MEYWSEARIRIAGVSRIALPPPSQISVLEGLSVTSISIDEMEPEKKHPSQTHRIRVEFDGGEELQSDLSAWADEILDRTVDVIGVVAGMATSVLSSSCGWVDDAGKGHAVIGTVGPTRPESKIEVRASGHPIQLGATPRERKAMRYLRRGMAQHTPDERFNTIFLAVMILARHFEPRRRTSEQFCPHCKKRLPPRPTGEREYLLNLGEQLNGWSAKDVKELWDLRNRLPGHGQAHLDRQARDELSAGSVKAAHLAYDALKAISGNHWPDRPHDLWMMDAIGPGIELHMTYTRASDAGPSETTDERGSQSS